MITVNALFKGGPYAGQFKQLVFKEDPYPPAILMEPVKGYHDPVLPEKTEIINYAIYKRVGDVTQQGRPGVFQASYDFVEYRSHPLRSISRQGEE